MLCTVYYQIGYGCMALRVCIALRVSKGLAMLARARRRTTAFAAHSADAKRRRRAAAEAAAQSCKICRRLRVPVYVYMLVSNGTKPKSNSNQIFQV
jgi:hypothetical protein